MSIDCFPTFFICSLCIWTSYRKNYKS